MPICKSAYILFILWDRSGKVLRKQGKMPKNIPIGDCAMLKRLKPGFTAFLLVFSLVSPISYYNRVPGTGPLLPLTMTEMVKTASQPVAKYVPETIRTVNSFDYYADSVTGLTSKSYSAKKINKLLADYGTFDGPLGMPDE